jgi:hypothetical protein
MARTQNFNSIKLTTSNDSEKEILLREVEGKLYIGNEEVVTVNSDSSVSAKSVTTTTYTQETGVSHFLYDDTTAGGAISVDLLNPTGVNKVTQHKKIGNTADITLNAPATYTIDGENSFTLTNQYESITLYSNGSNYFIQ